MICPYITALYRLIKQNLISVRNIALCENSIIENKTAQSNSYLSTVRWEPHEMNRFYLVNKILILLVHLLTDDFM